MTDIGYARIMKENVTESIPVSCRCNRLFHARPNDSRRTVDNIIVDGPASLWETMEALTRRNERGHDGWFVLDLFPYRDAPGAAVEECVRDLNFDDGLPDRGRRDELCDCVVTADALDSPQRMRRTLGGF